MKKSPLQKINDRFGSKDKLVAELKTMFDKGDLFIERLNADKGLASVANAKLLKLYDTAAEVKEKFASRDKLIADLLDKMGRAKDVGLKERFENWGLPRLWDYHKSLSKRLKKEAAKKA